MSEERGGGRSWLGGDSSERKEGKEVRGRMENYENAEDKNGGEDENGGSTGGVTSSLGLRTRELVVKRA